MKRRLFGILSVLSLVLCIVTCAAWVRSLKHLDEIIVFRTSPHEGPADEFELQSMDGTLWFSWLALEKATDESKHTLSFWHDEFWPIEYLDAQKRSAVMQHPRLARFGCYRMEGHIAGGTKFNAIGGPIFLLAILAAVLPARWLLRVVVARRRRQKNLCRKCGYDLRATAGRCPECGTETKMPGGRDPCRTLPKH